ncbi:MAG: DUF1667 domain-containing protein [Candidatus Odinarchaeia archaeon]
MKKEIICIICPQGCTITVSYTEDQQGQIKVLSVEGSACKRGEEYAIKEVVNPERTVTSSVLVEDGELPLVSVRTDKPIPKKLIFQIMDILKKAKVKAPVRRGQIIVENILNTGANIIATRTVKSVNT